MDKEVKKVCKCENCGNEAEMVITCTLPDEAEENPEAHKHEPETDASGKIKGTGVCSVCGNEADMWIEP